jgi:hypothetical protein
VRFLNCVSKECKFGSVNGHIGNGKDVWLALEGSLGHNILFALFENTSLALNEISCDSDLYLNIFLDH